MPVETDSALEWLAERPHWAGESIAFSAPGRPPLTHAALRRQIRDAAATLTALGLGRDDRVGLVSRQAPETASAILALAARATCAPLSPNLRPGEYDFLLDDLDMRALVVPAGLDSPARSAARARGIPVIELRRGAEVGAFTLCGEALPAPARSTPSGPPGTALVLHTSGTTARPKQVCLTHAHLAASARNIATALALRETDRCLTVMPLFHIHGIMVTLAALWTGGEVVCLTDPFSPSAFLDAVAECRPTWYSAVPTIHHAVLDELERRRDRPGSASLRLIRSSSAALPIAVAAALEAAFGAPVIEAFGMTEAAHQITSNPLPPGVRKPGSVGLPVGTEVAVLDAEGRPLPPGAAGEIAIRGDNVSLRGPDGWLRTGDLGILDQEGYLFITGRLKEQINRGGEKVSPREVDEALSQHPAVARAVAFGVPHPTLGETVAAAIVLKAGRAATAAELRRFVAAHLADFKVPGRIHIVDTLPVGATGKIQRRALAETFAAAERPAERSAHPPAVERAGSHDSVVEIAIDPIRASQTVVESALIRIWESVLNVRPVGVRDDFFELGGHSLLAARLFAEIEKGTGRRLPLATLFQAPTVEDLARLLRREGWTPPRSSLVAIQTRGRKRPLFCVHPHGGHVLCYRELARELGSEQPVFGLEARGLDGVGPPHRRIEDMATDYLGEIRAVQATGPYFLAGYCFGGMVALEMARQLVAQGERVALLALLQTYRRPSLPRGRRAARGIRLRTRFEIDRLLQRPAGERPAYLLGRAREAMVAAMGRLAAAAGKTLRSRLRRPRAPDVVADAVEAAATEAARRYTPAAYPGSIMLFRWSEIPAAYHGDPWLGWRDLATGGVIVHELPGHEPTMLAGSAVGVLARQLARYLE